MQPYFLPYAGYFRLMVDVDAFVIADVQQFSRRGWGNRNRLRDDKGELGWLTLPLKRQPLGTSIRELAFADGAELQMRRECQRFAACRHPREHTRRLVERMRRLDDPPLEMIVDLLQQTASLLALSTPVLRQSTLGLPEELHGAEHVHAVCEALGAREYVNASGGRALHDAAQMRRRGLRLLFHRPYQGDLASILQRLHDADETVLRQEIIDQSQADDG